MTQDVLIKISGLHYLRGMGDMEDNHEPIEIIAPANYYFKNGKHYILYDEPMEGGPGVIKNKIKITGTDSIEIMKSGMANAHMIFEKNQQNFTFYDTPYGQLQVGIHTRMLDIDVKEEEISVEVDYGLEFNHEAAADCHITMDIRPKNAAGAVM